MIVPACSLRNRNRIRRLQLKFYLNWNLLSQQGPKGLLSPRFQPMTQIDGRERALVLARLLHGGIIKLCDPYLIRARAVLGERKPHQSARGLARHMIAFEQHGAEHLLRLALSLLCGKPEPARGLTRIVRRAGAVEIEPRQ